VSSVVLALVLATGLTYLWQGYRLRRLADERLGVLIGAVAVEEVTGQPRRVVRTFPRRNRAAVVTAGTAVGLFLWLGIGAPLVIAGAVGVLIGVIAHLAEIHVSEQQSATIEGQLASAISLMVGSLRAGASLLAAFESALEEVGPPLRPYFQEVAARIRLGDDPRAAVSDLQVGVPLETFRLFATSLAIHWDVGGSLATTLSTVGQTIRDRIELSRRVRAQSVESTMSVAVVMGIAYILAFLMWRTSPDRMEAFVGTDLGTVIVAGVIVLQALGLIWMAKLNQETF
jgi:tight adherence protein B